MARGGKKNLNQVPPAGGAPGHNSGQTAEQINDEQQQVLLLQHMKTIAGLKNKIASFTADLRNAYKVAKAEGFPKQDIDYAFNLQKDEDEEMLKRRGREEQIARWLQHPIGTQAELFGKTTDPRPLKERAYDQGKLDGIKAEGPLNPPYDPGSDGYEGYAEGWHAGQAAIFNIQKTPAPEAEGLLRPEGNEPAMADEFDAASEPDPDVVAAAEAEVPDAAPWPDDVAIAQAAAPQRELAEAL